MYVTPVSPREVCVALIAHTPDVRLEEGLRHFPKLAAHLHDVPPSSSERGAVTAIARLRSVARGNVALVGDASGSVDAITGEGLCQAFQQSAALADAIMQNNLASYGKIHRQIAFRPSVMGDLMLTMDRWPGIRRRALGAMAKSPATFSRMLAGHVGALQPWQLIHSSLSLGWQMLKN